MDRSAVKTIVDREIEPLVAALGIQHWRITVSYEALSTDAPGAVCKGQCTRRPKYNQAHIEINFDAIDDESDLLNILRHELFHVVLSPFDLYGDFAGAYITPGTPQAIQDGQVWSHAVEQAVINLERMYLGLMPATARPKARKR